MPEPTEPSRRIPDADVDEAARRLDRVFALLGLVDGANLVCPACGTSKTKKVYFKTSKSGGSYWACWVCGAHSSGIKLYQERTGASFPQAIAAILDRIPGQSPIVALPTVTLTPSFTAVHDIELYDKVLATGNRRSAQDYWATWHISPEAVAESGSTAITNSKGLERMLERTYGLDRLKAAGLVVETKNGEDMFLINSEYPVIEPQLNPDGHVSAMQFRASLAKREKVEAHKRFKLESGDSAGDGPKYVAPFMSPKGAQGETLIGYGLHMASQLEPGTPIYVVEGLKDWLAARTLRPDQAAYAIPGTSVMPPPVAIEVLKRLRVIAVLDGDAAGAAGREKLVAYLTEHGVKASAVNGVREGMDIADILVEKNAKAGCTCATCSDFMSSALRQTA